MRDLFLYLDETGQLGMSGESYFGLGQAAFRENYSEAIRDALQLRFELERNGIHLPRGFHAKDDTDATRVKVFELIANHAPRVDVTLLNKRYIPEPIRSEIESDRVQMYYRAWQKHFSYQARYVLKRSDRVFVVAASLFEHRRKQQAARAAIESVLKKFAWLDLTLCVWDNPTTWGLQVADYALWAVQRDLINGSCKHFAKVSPFIETVYSPWEKDGSRLEFKPAAESRRRQRPLGTLIFNRDRGKPPAARSSIFEKHEKSDPEDEWIDGYVSKTEVPERFDPMATTLWGTSQWSDDDPWEEFE